MKLDQDFGATFSGGWGVSTHVELSDVWCVRMRCAWYGDGCVGGCYGGAQGAKRFA